MSSFIWLSSLWLLRLLTSERGLYHRSNRPIEPEAVFGDIKQNHGFKRFKLKSNTKVKVEFGLVALAHNLRKYIAVERILPLRSPAHKIRRGRPFLTRTPKVRQKTFGVRVTF